MTALNPTAFKQWLSENLKGSALIRRYLWKNRKLVAIGLTVLVFVDILEIAPPLLMKRAFDTLAIRGPFGVIIECATLYFLVFILQGFGRYGWRMYLIRSSFIVGRDLRQEFVAHLFKLPSAFYDKNRVGDMMSLANGDVESVRMFTGPGMLTFADSIFYILTVPAAMYFLNPRLAFITLAPIPLIPFVVRFFEKRIHARYKAAQNHYSELSSMAQESLNGIRLLKAFAKESKQEERFRELGEKYIQLNLRLARVQTSFGPLMDFFTSLGLVALIWFGGKDVIQGTITIGTLVAFQRFIQKMVWPMMALGFSMGMFQRAKASSDRVMHVLEQKSEITEKPGKKRIRSDRGTGFGDARGISIRNLSFSYPGSSGEPTLKDINLVIEPGMRVGIMGAVGSGKTTLLQLIPRLYQAPDQTISVGGTFVEDWDLEELRRTIGMVAQDVFLFSETLEKNISFREPGLSAAARATRVKERLEHAAFSEDIAHLEKGVNTVLGERGVTLSGGQKQRVSIARALFDAPSILLFDDALSAVDVKTEGKLLQSLKAHVGDSTLLYSAHRMSSVKDADLIAVLEKGQIVQRGKHTDLLKDKSGIYHRFYEQQRLREEYEASIREFEERQS